MLPKRDERFSSAAAASNEPAVDLLSTEADLEKLRVDIVRAVTKVCPHWLGDEADDLVQNAMTRILERIWATQGRQEMSTGYLYRTAFSVVIDEIRRRRRLNEVPLEWEMPIPSPEGNPERQMFGREVREELAVCLATFPPDVKRALVLHLMGHSIAEISAILNCSRKQTENRVYRNLARVRVYLKLRGVI